LQPIEERLHDVLFELDLRERAQLPTRTGRVRRLRKTAVELADELGLFETLGTPATAARLRKFRAALFDPSTLRTAMESNEAGNDPGELGWVARYLRDDGVAARGERSCPVPGGAEEVAAIVEMQGWIRERIHELNITVEANPSSNRLIMNAGLLKHLPVWQLREPQNGSPRVPITINDDDPLTFATCLVDEYAYLYAELLRMGRTSKQALKWIDSARRRSLESRFTFDVRAHAAELRAHIAGEDRVR
jgi:hypothetical protein